VHSWLVWSVFGIACVLLGFIGHHFAVRTLRFVTALFALAVVVVVIRYGVAHQSAGAHADLVNSFTQGFDALSKAFFQPLLGGGNPVPGRIGWLVIVVLLAFGYRELEAGAMSRQPPTVDLTALGGDRPDTQNGGAQGEQDKAATDQQRYNEVASQIRFRLPAVAVRAPSILPGGTGVAGLVSIAESTGNGVGGLAGAIIDFVGTLWPNPRKYQIRIWVEPSGNERKATHGVKVTVDLENSRTGESIATKTLPAGQLDEADCVVAGYVARQIFSEDPTAPPWCYGSFDGSDLAALLSAWQDRVYPESSDVVRESRYRQMHILERGASSSVCAGVTRYELAQLRDIEGFHVEALRLHAINREQYPRFRRGQYRLGMSLEMIANREFELNDQNPVETLRECLRILDGCRPTRDLKRWCDDIGTEGTLLPPLLRKDLLEAAQDELRTVRRQLYPWRIIWASFVHRDERAIWKHYWRLAERQRFRDAARVAELLVAVRLSLIKKEGHTKSGSGRGPSETRRDEQSGAGQPSQGGHASKVRYHLRKVRCHSRTVMNIYNLARARWIVAAITGENAAIKAALKPEKDDYQLRPHAQPGPRAARTRRVPWQHSTPSWQAAYSAACLYSALAYNTALEGKYDEEGKFDENETQRTINTMTRQVIASLKRAINDRHCEMGRPSDWIERDPDFSFIRSTGSFKTFFNELKESDYPEVSPVPAEYHYLMAKGADKTKDRAEVRRHLRDLAHAARRRRVYRNSAVTIGKAALIAERIGDTTIALELHVAAQRADPTDWNVTQHFVDFIIDQHLAEYFGQARQMVTELQDSGKGYKPLGTEMLALRLASVTGSSVSEKIQEPIDSFLKDLSTDPTKEKLEDIFSFGKELLPPVYADRACRIACEAGLDDSAKYHCLQLFADFLAKSSDGKAKAKAVDLYLYLLKTGMAGTAGISDESQAIDVKHHLACELINLGFTKSAALLWESIYQDRPEDEDIRRRFAHALDKIDHTIAAAAVSIGRDVPALKLQAEALPFPFAKNVDQWWERLPVGTYPPCPVPSFLNLGSEGQ
jgi:hypothetical protein